MNIESFLTNHKRGCTANKGQDCTCGLFEARAELACLLTRQARLQAIEKEVKKLDAILDFNHRWTDEEITALGIQDRRYFDAVCEDFAAALKACLVSRQGQTE